MYHIWRTNVIFMAGCWSFRHFLNISPTFVSLGFIDITEWLYFTIFTSLFLYLVEQGLEKSNKVAELTQCDEEVDVEKASLPPFPDLPSVTTSTASQRFKRQKVFTKNHLKRNTVQKKCENKLHKCSICGKCYSRAFTLKTHYRVHTGEKPYKCPFCKRQFTQSGGLDSHLRTHTGQEKKRC